MNKPFFICGHPRSGTSLVYNHIIAAFKLAPLPETQFFNQIYGLDNAEALARLTGKYFDHDLSDWLATDGRDPSQRKRFESLIAALGVPADDIKKQDFAEKTPDNIIYIKRVRELYPDAYFIFCIRDPRSVISSEIRIGEWAKSPTFRCLKWIRSALIWITGNYNGSVICYEQFVKDPQVCISTLESETGMSAGEITDELLQVVSEKTITSKEHWRENSGAIQERKPLPSVKLGFIPSLLIFFLMNPIYQFLKHQSVGPPEGSSETSV
ncbi:MAG: sulfotransferase [Verrucomicrobiota bacterium]